MTTIPEWWRKPRRVSVVVDNDSWILPFAERLVAQIAATGDTAGFYRDHDAVPEGGVVFFLGCVRIASGDVLARHRRNLVVHESDLPRGRGFSPLTWQILEGRSEIPICLVEMTQDADAGPVIYRDRMIFEGHELIDRLRAVQGDATIALCMRYLNSESPPAGTPQQGAPTSYRRRRPLDSRLDPEQTLASQFDLLRVVDNDRYPAFFEWRGKRYVLSIRETPEQEEKRQ